ncbi:MAG: hypothetical protein EKK61_01505 [Rickettsiales bacterium]|nr:MAG: hypothetical protein EKK61_01505 [Rickettsiales bacterium]
MSEHSKFELEELSKSAVVNSTISSPDVEVDKIIHEVVTEHLSNIVKNNDVSVENNDNINNNFEEKIDIEAVKQESYERGVQETKVKYEEELKKVLQDNDFSNLLQEKLNIIIPSQEIDSQIAKISAEAISGIAKKLHLILSVNFEEIIEKGLFEKLKSFYKEGQITLTIHSSREEFCKDILKTDKISDKIKDNFQIAVDDKMNKDDCKIEWMDTRLEYNQEQLSGEIDKIIEQLKSAA